MIKIVEVEKKFWESFNIYASQSEIQLQLRHKIVQALLHYNYKVTLM